MKQIIRVTVMLGALLVLSYSAYAEENPHLETARHALDQLDYPAAAAALEDALRWGKNTPAAMVDIYQLLGKVYAALDKPLKAETYFRQLLAISPQATLPGGSSPKLKRPFQAAKEYMKQYEPLAASCKADTGALSVVLQVSSDPLNMIAGAKALYRDANSAVTTAEAQGRQAITVKIPARARVEVVCVAIDEFGNHLIEVGSFAEPLVITPSADQVAEQAPQGEQKEGGDDNAVPDKPAETNTARQKPGFFARWTTWGALALVAGGAGTYFAIEAGNDQDELDSIIADSSQYDYARAKEVEDRGARNALIANISLGVAGACTVAAVVFLLRGDGSSEEEGEDRVTIAPTPLPGGGAVTFHIPF